MLVLELSPSTLVPLGVSLLLSEKEGRRCLCPGVH